MDDVELARLRKNLLAACDLHDTGVELMRLSLRRQYPSETDEQIGRRLRAWLHRDDQPLPPGFRRRPTTPTA